MEKIEDDEIKFLAQGTYGCVYNKEISCNGEDLPINKDKFVSKVQFQGEGDYIKETEIGKELQKVFQHDSFFAPILQTCPIDIGVINQEEIHKCNVIKKSNSEETENLYVSSKIKFVGKESITDYLESKLSKEEEIKAILETHLHLLKALHKMSFLEDPIIHYDLKSNNILLDELYNLPIIIDFGLSFGKSKILKGLENPEILRELFYVYYDNYPPWTIEIILLSYVFQNIVFHQDNHEEINIEIDKIDKYIEFLQKVVHEFASKNVIFKDDEKKEFTENMIKYISSFETKTLRIFIDDLLGSWRSWDNYAIAVMYYSYLSDRDIDLQNDNYIRNYMIMLKKIILSTPESKRYVPKDTYDSIVLLAEGNLPL
jgi:serine/threonine protein kinase